MSSVELKLVLSTCFIVLTCHCVSAADVTTLHYNITEQLPTGSQVGDVINDAGLASRYEQHDVERMRFHFRHVAGQSRESRDLFIIDEKSGVIRTNHVIDRDRMCALMTSCSVSVDVTVRPVDLFQMFRVIINIIDINDNSPTFSSDRLDLNIVETSAVGTVFSLPAAEDIDSGKNGVQEYQLQSANRGDNSERIFELQVTNQVDGSKDVKLCLVGGLDRELVSSYQLLVIAVDGGAPVRSATLSVHVTVTDANDNKPQFDQSSYEVDVNEDLPAQTTIIQLHATDSDTGLNGRLVYTLSHHSLTAYGHLFDIKTSTGEVFLKDQLDFEQEQTYQLTVSASDQGPASLPVFTKLTVRVHDVNDNPPLIAVNTLTGSRDARVHEHIDAAGTFLAHIAVTDADSGLNGQTECQLGSQDNEYFQLEVLQDTAEYKLITRVVFDRESRDRYTVTVTCRDHGLPSLSTDLHIHIYVVDINDHSPRLLHSELVEISLPENNAANILLARINATDDDAGKNHQLHYSLTPLDSDVSSSVLLIDAVTGAVTTNNTFDYEVGPSELWYLVTVTDGGDSPRSATATIHLTITDTNDQRPTFDRSVYHITIPEDIAVGSSVGRVVATDADVTAVFRRVRYQLVTPSDNFELEATTGVIRTASRLDRETKDSYLLSVIATEELGNTGGGNTGSQSNTCQVTISIEDVNDNKPVFVSPPAAAAAAVVELHVSANQQTRGALVTRFVAVDADLGLNAELTYSIVHGNELSLFTIDTLTGALTVAVESLDRQTYKLVVSATDHGQPRLSDVIDVDINVMTASTALSSDANSSLLLDSNTVIVLSGLAAGLILVTCCIVLAVVCFRRKARHQRTKYQPTAQSELPPRPPSSTAYGPPSMHGPSSMHLDLQLDPVDSHLDDSRSLSAFYCKDTSSLRETCSINSPTQRCHHCDVTGGPDVTSCGLHHVSGAVPATFVIDGCELQQYIDMATATGKPATYNMMTSSGSRVHMLTTPRPGACNGCCCETRPRPSHRTQRYRPTRQHATSASSCNSTHSSSSAASSRAPSPRNTRQSTELRTLPDMLRVLTRDNDVTTVNNRGRQLSIDVSESEVASTDSGRGLSCQGHDELRSTTVLQSKLPSTKTTTGSHVLNSAVTTTANTAAV